MTIVLTRGDLRAEIGPRGAELLSFQDGGDERIWSADPAIWDRSAPILFPVIGHLPVTEPCFPGGNAPMPLHGIAPAAMFEETHRTGDEAHLSLADTDQTREVYPHAFRLEIQFGLTSAGLLVKAKLENPATAPLPFSFGFHPGFVCDPEEGASLVFETEETGPVYRAHNGRLSGGRQSSPIAGCTLPVTPRTFADGAIVLPEAKSRRISLVRPGKGALEVSFDTPDLALWSRPGAAFVCIEPWCGLPAGGPPRPARMLAPGASADFRHTIRVADVSATRHTSQNEVTVQ